jgi:hypothetical protein
VRLAANQLKKIDRLIELLGGNRSTIVRGLIDHGLDSTEVTLLLRRPGVKGRGAAGRVVRAVAANLRAKAAQLALMRKPSIKAEIDALRAEEEEAEATAAYAHHHPKKGGF